MAEGQRRFEQFEKVIARQGRQIDGLRIRLGTRITSLGLIVAGFEAELALGFRPGEPVYYTTPGAITFDKGDFPGMRAVIFECQGGGGGSGGCVLTGAGVAAVSSGGAGSCYARSLILEADLAASEAGSVGDGGAAGAAGNNAGSTGGDTFIDTVSSEVRGAGGPGGAGSGAAAASGSTGRTAGTVTGSVGDLRLPGGDGQGSAWRNAGTDIWFLPGGGSAHLAPKRDSGFTSNAGAGGLAGQLYGGGAAGAYNFPSQAARGGGDGAQGILIATPLY